MQRRKIWGAVIDWATEIARRNNIDAAAKGQRRRKKQEDKPYERMWPRQAQHGAWLVHKKGVGGQGEGTL